MKNFSERILAIVLSVAVVLNSLGMMVFSAGKSDENSAQKTIKLGKIIAENYEWLNEHEKALLSADALVGDSYTVSYPQNAEDLILIDAADKQITAKNFVDEHNNVWVPTVVKIIYKNSDGTDASPINVKLDENGNGSFSCPANTYRAEVEYTVYADVSKSVQEKFVNYPDTLTEGITNIELLNLSKNTIAAIGYNIDDLYALTTGEYKFNGEPVGFEEGTPEYIAITTMYNQCEAEAAAGNPRLLRISTLLAEFSRLNAEGKLRFLIDKGSELKDEIDLILKCTKDITESDGTNGLLWFAERFKPDLYSKASDAVKVLNDIKNSLSNVASKPWYIIQPDEDLPNNPVRADASAEEISALASSLAAAYTVSDTGVTSKVNHYDNPDVTEKLKIASTVLTLGVDQHKVNVTVRAAVIDKNSIDKNDLTVLNEENSVFLVLDKDTEKKDIISAIKASGVEQAALDRWDNIYNGDYAVNDTNYDIEVSGIPDTLTSDVNVIIKYVPKKYKVSYSWAESTEVYYGYNLLLPKHSNSEKSYDYTVNNALHREDTVFTVKGDTVISRREAKATSKYSIPVAILSGSVEGVELTEKEKAVLKSNGFIADNIWYRVPDQSAGLVTVVAGESSSEGIEYEVTAADYSSGLLSGAVWSPVNGRAVTADGKVICEFKFGNRIADGKARFVTAESFDHVEVVLNAVVSDILGEEINKWINVPHILKTEAEKQKAEIAPITAKNILDNLNEIKESTLTSVSALGSPETKAAIDKLLDENNGAFADGKLKIYTYLNNYTALGLSYYYRAGVYENIDFQLNLLRDSLNIMWADAKLQEVLERDYPQYKTKLSNVRDILSDVNLVGVRGDIINRYDNNGIANLVAALEALDKTQSYTATNPQLVLSAVINGDAPDRTSVTLTVQKTDAAGALAGNPVSGALSFETGAVFTENDIEALNSLKESLENKLNIDKSHYTVSVEGSMPSVGSRASEPLNIVYTWSPKIYTVVVDDVELQFNAGGLLSVMLPKWDGALGYRYTYIIGGDKIAVGTDAVEYTFKNLAAVDALADSDGKILIKREVTDIYRENVIALVNSLNKTIAKNNLTFSMGGQQCLMAAFIPLENKKTKELSIVLRVSPQRISSVKTTIKNTATNAVTDILNSGFTYIGMNGETFWGNGKITLQTLINAVLSSDLSFDYICDIISANGDLKDITTVVPSLAESDVIGVGKDGMIDVAGSKISNFESLGAKLLAVNTQFGSNNANARNVPFYVTMEDFDLRASELSKVERAIRKVQNYVDVKVENGRVAVDARIPNSVYAYYMTAQTIAGNADISDINAMDLGKSLEYDINLIKDLIQDDTFTTGTIERTLKKLGRSKDLSEYASVFNVLRKAAAYLIKNGSIKENTAESSNSVYAGNVELSIRNLLLNELKIDETLAGAVTEAAEGSSLNAEFKLKIKNMDTDYDAMIVDVNAQGLKKLTYTNDLAASAASLHDKSVIVLLSDVDLKSDLIFNCTAVIDLNGKMINGNIKAGKTVLIADSRLDTYTTGGVNGTVSGNVRITGGKYTSNVTSMLREGYAQDENGYVVNKLYTVKANDSSIDVTLNADFLKTENFPAIKTYMADLAADFAVNMYPNAYFSVDGNVIYSATIDDAFSVIDLTKGEMIQKVIDMADLKGISDFANTVLSDITDFDAMHTALISGKPLASYKAVSKPWDLSLRLEGDKNNNYITADVVHGSQATQKTINLYVADSASSDSSLALLLNSLSDIVTVNELNVALNSITYNNRKLSADAKATADVLVDLSKNPDYSFVISAILADCASGSLKAELVSAMQEYAEFGIAANMKTAIEKADTALIIKAVKGIKSYDFAATLKKFGMESSSAAALESVYHDLLNVASVLLSKTEVTGNSTPLSAYAVDGEEGTYSISRQNWHKCDLKLTFKLFTKDKPIIVRDSFGIIKLVTDNLTEAFNSCENGYTVYVNDRVELDSNVNLSADINIVGAENIDFKGGSLTLTKPHMTVTADRDIGDYVVSGIAKHTVEKTEDSAKYIYTLTPPPVPAIVLKLSDNSEHEFSKDALAEAIRMAGDGSVITVNVPVKLEENTEISSGSVEIVNAANINMNGKVITLSNTNSRLVTDAALEHDSVVTNLKKYEIRRTEENGKFVYKTEKLPAAIIVIYETGDSAEYDADDLADLLENPISKCTIRIMQPVTLSKDVKIKNDITIENVSNIDMNGHKMILTNTEAQLVTDSDMNGSVETDNADLKLTVNQVGGKYIYKAQYDLPPEIPAIEVRHSNGETTEYKAEELAKAFEKAEDGDVILIHESVVLSKDVEIANNIKICGAELIDMNGKELKLSAAAASIATDIPLNNVKSNLSDYELNTEEKDNFIIYTLKPINYKIIVKDSNGSVKVKYRNDDLVTALKSAANGDTVVINASVSLAETVGINTNITIVNAADISFGSEKIVLTPLASVTADSDIVANIAAPEYYEVVTEGSYKYSLKALEPEISVPTVNVQADGLIRGAKVDSANKYIYIDTDPKGLKAANFSLVTFTTVNTSNKTVVISNGKTVRGDSDFVCTGDTVTVTASNTAGKTTSVTYTLIVLGDTNCNGIIDSGDPLKIALHATGSKKLTGVSLLAADVNCDGNINSGDSVKDVTKYTFTWRDKTYKSFLSNKE